MSNGTSTDEDVQLPPPPEQRHSPRTTTWDIKDEREAAGLSEGDPVHTPAGAERKAPVLTVSRAVDNLESGESVVDEERMHIRGVFTSLVSYSESDGGAGSLSGEVGRITLQIADDREFNELRSVLDSTAEDEAVSPRFLLAGVHRTVQGIVGGGVQVSFILDEESSWARVDPNQRPALVDLAQNGHGRLSEQVDLSPEVVDEILETRCESIRDALDGYSNIEVTVRNSHERPGRTRSKYICVSCNQLLLPADIAAIYDAFSDVGDSIRAVSLGERGETVRGVKYTCEVDPTTR